MRPVVVLALVGLLAVPYLPRSVQNPPPDTPAAQPLSEALVGDWRGFLILNDPTRNFTSVPAHLRFTRYGTVFYDREELFSLPSLHDWRADYEVVGSAIYMNPQRSPAGAAPPVVFSGVTVEDGRFEAVVLSTDGPVAGQPFGEWSGIAAALRMERR